MVSGMSLFSYWVGNYIMDILSAIPSMLLVIILVLIFDTATFSDGDAIGMLIICLLAFDLECNAIYISCFIFI